MTRDIEQMFYERFLSQGMDESTARDWARDWAAESDPLYGDEPWKEEL